MTLETAIKKSIKDYLSIMHIDWFYNLQAMGAYHGIPDLCFFNPNSKKLVFCEVKTPKGELSAKQVEFKEMVEKYNVEWLIARDVDDVIKHIKMTPKL